MARYKGFYIDPDFFRQVEEFVMDNRNSIKNFKFGMDAAVMLYAHATLAEAQKRSLGPLDPQETGRRLSGHRFIGSTSGPSRREPLYSPTAWKIPVRRISQEYFHGWYAERLGLAFWMVSNHSREAYFIEFGINHRGTGLRDSAGQRVRIRRPILKLSVLAAYNLAEGTNYDLVAFKGIFEGTYHSPALYETASSAPGRTFPISGGLTSQLRSQASQLSTEQLGGLMKSVPSWWNAASKGAE